MMRYLYFQQYDIYYLRIFDNFSEVGMSNQRRFMILKRVKSIN